MTLRVVSYVRVSTAKQGRSGLGLDAQREIVARYVDQHAARLLEEFCEVESGKVSARPELAKALELCKVTGATLLVAKLDRLARSVHFISGLMKQNVPFIVAELPNATPFMLNIYASVAEEEAHAISARTKAALAAARTRGRKLGGPRPGPKIRHEHGLAARIANADAFAAKVLPYIRPLHDRGESLRAIAAELTARGIRTRRGCAWTAAAVNAVLARSNQDVVSMQRP